ncbi:MAG: Ig-like domain-containing protein [Holophagales bacterium]|nr:Ig-like domain-containing protein [Holophagales bacterium]
MPIVIPDREGYSRLAASFSPGSCAAGTVETGLGGGFLSLDEMMPCDPPKEAWPGFWVGRGDQPWPVLGRMPLDPTGATVSRYELVVDGVTVFTLDGPLEAADYTGTIDLSALGEGSHTFTERYTYAGEAGLLGTCPQDFPLTLDRTPPQVAISEPENGAFICPEDLEFEVVLEVDDETLTNESILVDGGGVAGSHACAPYGAPGGTYRVEAERIEPGLRQLQARVRDQAGNAACTFIEIQVPPLPSVRARSSPPVFSPLNGLGRPTEAEIAFSIGTTGFYELTLTDADGNVLRYLPLTPTDGEEELVAWDGTDPLGALAPDGTYRALVQGTSPCGASDQDVTTFELDVTPPEVVIGAPEPGRVVGSSLEFRGLVHDPHFEIYRLQVRQLDGGSGDWVTVSSQTRQTLSTDAPLGVWRTDGFPAGDYLVRIEANDRPGNVAWSAEVPVTVRERLLIKRFQREPEIFSPNGDGILDQLELELELFQDALVTLQVADETGTPVATLVDRQLLPGGAPGSLHAWAGELDAGGLAADAEYELVVLAEDPVVPPELDAEEERLSTTVDTVPPDLSMVNPVGNSLSGLPLAIVGSLDELHPDTHTLTLQDPEGERRQLLEGTGVFAGRTLYEMVDDPDGAYLALLEAVDLAGNQAQLSRDFRVDDTAPAVMFLAPEAGSVLATAEDYVALEGEIEEENLISWAFSYAPGNAPDPIDFVVIHGEQAPEGLLLSDGAVAWDWDASALADGPYTLRLEATDEPGRTVEARIGIVVDNTPPEVVISSPADGALVSDPADVLGSVSDANPKRWTLELSPAGGGPLELLGVGASNASGTLASWSVLPADGGYDLRLWAEDRAGNSSEVSVTVTVSVTPPGPPVLLSAEVENGRDAVLVWQPGPGPEPAGYFVYRGGTRVNGSPVEVLTLTDTGLADGLYTYTVAAVDPRGEESDPSNSLDVRIDHAAPLAKISVPAEGDRVSDQVQVLGTAYRESGLTGWTLRARPELGSWVPIGSGTAPVLADLLAVWDTVLFPNGVYDLRLEVSDVHGNQASDQITVEVDNTEPVAPVLTFAAAAAQDPDAEVNDIHVEWQLDPTPADLAGYYLYRNGQLANAPGPVVGSTEPFLIDGLLFDDKDLVDGTYTYFVTAADTAGNESAPSNPSDPITIDTRRPHAVIVDPENGHAFEQSVVLIAEVEDLDVVSVQFEVRPAGGGAWSPLGAALPTAPWQVLFEPADLGLTVPGIFEVRAVASDGVGPDPAPESITVEETDLAPEAPSELDLRVDGGTVHLSWTAVADPTGDLAGYHVYRDAQLLTPVPLATDQLDFSDSGDSGTGLADGGYSYRITAVDSAGNEGLSSPWEFGVVTTPAFGHVVPITPLASLALRADVFEYNDEVDLAKRDASGVLQVIATIAAGGSDVSLPPVVLDPGLNRFSIEGRSVDGDRTKRAADLLILRRDPPAAPENVTAEVLGADVTVSWTPETDPALHGYDVDREGTPLGFATSTWTYDPGHGLVGSSGGLAQWQLAVDGIAGTVWTPTDTASQGAVLEWTWGGETFLRYVDVRFGTRASRFSVDVLVDGEWLWWHYRPFNFSTLRRIDLGLAVEGLRLRIPPGFFCTGCTVAELTPLAETRPAGPPVLDPGRPPGIDTYGVGALDRYGLRSERVEAQVLIGVEAPAPPTGMLAEATGCAEITASWQAPATLPVIHLGYRLERSVAGGVFSPLAEVGPSQLALLDTGLAAGVAYTYRARTLAEIDGTVVASLPSEEASATASCDIPPPPELIEPTVAGVPVDWPFPVADVGGRAHPGSEVTLVHDGDPIRTLLLPSAAADRSWQLPGLFGLGDVLALGGDLASGGGRAAYAVDAGGVEALRLVDLAALGSGAPAFSDIPGTEPRDPDLSPDGDALVFTDWQPFRTDLYLLDLPTGERIRLTDDEDDVWSPRFLPNGRTVIYLARDDDTGQESLRRLDLSTGGVEEIWSHPFYSFQALGLSADGDLATIATWDGPKVVDLATGELVQEIWTYASPAFARSPFSADGRELVFVSPSWSASSARIHVAEVATGAFEVVSSEAGEVAAAYVDDRTLALLQTRVDGTLRLLTRSRIDGAESVWAEGIDPDALPSLGSGAALDRGRDGAIWLATAEGLVRLERPSGSFVFPNVELSAGTNTFVARQEIEVSGGTDEQDSLPIEVNVDAAAFGNARVVSLLAAPGFPLAGQTVAVEGLARNDGPAELGGLVASLLRISPAGVAEVVKVETFDLGDGEERRVRYLWDTTGQLGDYRFRFVLDPADEIVETDEGDNTALLEVPVRITFGLEAALRTDRGTYQVGESVALLATIISNAPAAETEVVLGIETPTGEPVATVATWTLDSFGGSRRELQSVWSTEGIYPAPYRARVRALQGGVVVAEAEAAFEVEARIGASITSSADRPSYVRGTIANLLARVRNEGDATLRDATVRLLVEPSPAGRAVASQDRQLQPLPVGGLASVSWAFETQIEPGAYNFRAVVLDSGGDPMASSDPYPFVVTAVGAALTGTLGADPAVLEPGESLDLLAEVTNLGDVAVPGSSLRAEVVDPAAGAVLHTIDDTADLGLGATVERAWPYTPAMTTLRPFLVLLSATDDSGARQQLASVAFTLADLTPPTLELLPLAPVCTPSLELRVRADDRLSGIRAVTYTVDGGTFALPMILESVDGDVWTSLLSIDPERQDPYHFEVIAEDTAGNVSDTLMADLLPEVDSEAPLLDIQAPADGSCVAGPVSAFYEATDANLDTLFAWLDGEPYASGTPIADGEHELRVLATDACSLATEDVRSFVVDSVAPAIELVGVEDNGIYEEPVTLEWTVDDPNLVSVTALLDGLEITSPHTVEEPGSYLLELEAVDCAGNLSVRMIVFQIGRGVSPVEIPTLGPWTLALLTLLLTSAGFVVLRRRQVGDRISMMHDLHRHPGRRAGFLVLPLLLFGQTALPTGAEAEAPASDLSVPEPVASACRGQLPELRAVLGIEEIAPGRPLDLKGTSGTAGALLRELELEEALWRDELRRRSEELEAFAGSDGASGAEAAGGGGARDRLETLDAAIRGHLEALRASVRDGSPLPEPTVATLSACLAGEGAGSTPSDGEPISSRLAPPAPELEPRRPRRSPAGAETRWPEGYLDPPSEAFRQRMVRERSGQRAGERAGGEVAGLRAGNVPGDLTMADLSADDLAGLTAPGSVPSEKAAPGRQDPIAAKVSELGGDPVALYRFVLEQIRPAHYFGSIRGPEATLHAGEGNDADQASLLAALLRAADVPARVAWGVREIGVDDLRNHFGLGPSAPFAELERILSAAGIPWQPVLQGGQPSAYVLERAWCEVYLPFANYRGVVLDDTGAGWIALDPQLATLEPRQPTPALDTLGIDGRAYVDAYLAGDLCTPPLDVAGACPPPSEDLRTRVDALGGGGWDGATAPAPAVPQDDPILPAGMVGTLESVLGFGFELPPEMSHRVRLRARDGARILMDATVPAAALSGLESVIWFQPATLDDRALVAAYGDLWLVPPYLVNVVPELWVDGESLAIGTGALGMGQAFELEVTLLLPSGDQLSFRNSLRTGVPVGLGLAPGVHGYRPPEGGPGNTPEVLTTLVGAYLDATGAFAGHLARLEGLPEVHPYPSFVTVGSVVEPMGLFGLVEELRWLGIYIDADVFGPRVAAPADASRRWLELAQLEASAQERVLFEAYGMESVSADQMVVLARDRGQTVLTIDLSNLAAVLPTLPFPQAVLDEIEGWVRAGGEALVPEAELDFVEFSGVGYLLRDGLTGEARYQLSGRLSGQVSGGMIAVPPFEVAPGLASPLQVPQNGEVISDGTKAVSVEIFDGSLQIAEVGETLGSDTGRPLRVLVKDPRGRLVSNAEVIFQVLAGGGNFGGADTITVTSQGGVASTEVTVGTLTDENPYFLLFPDEEWSQRTDLTVITAEVNGYPMNDLAYEVGRPGNVTQLLTPYGTSYSGLPHVSLGVPLRVVPADQYQNPVANQEVTFNLAGSPPEPGKGPELLSDDAKLACGGAGVVLAGECGATSEVVDEGSVSGVWAHLVVGEETGYQVTATATGDDASGSATFVADAVTDFILTDDLVGFPSVLVSARGQPRAEGGESREAYAPGAATVPLRVSLVVFTEEFRVHSCSGGSFCTDPLGTYKTRRLATDGLPNCSPDRCSPSTLVESGEVTFDGAGSGTTVGSPVEEGVYEHVITMPDAPGRYRVRVSPFVNVAVPKRPADPDRPDEVVPCIPDDASCGAELELGELSDPNWGTSFVLWTVRGRIQGDPPVVFLGHDKTHETETVFPYEIEPPDYPAATSAVVFVEDGTVPVFAQAEGRGPGSATLPVGKVFDHPEGNHEVKVMVNPGWQWSPDTGEPVSMRVDGEPVPLNVVMLDADLDSDNDNGADLPDGDIGEENIEEAGGDTGWGKLVFANHDDSDGDTGDGRPDYADLEIPGETSMAPLTLEIRPEGGSYGGVGLTFDYDGPGVGDVPTPGYQGTSLGTRGGHEYFDYTDVEVGTFRIWNAESASSARTVDDYVEPDRSYTAAELGFGPGSEKKTFWVEGINGVRAGQPMRPSDLGIRLTFGGESTETSLKLTVVEGDLGLNHGNDDPDLRPGIPDVPFLIDDTDDRIEDQADGFRFWRNTWGGLDQHGMQDLMPMIADLPEDLLDDWEVGLRFSGPAHLAQLWWGAPRSDASRLDHLKSEVAAEGLIAAVQDKGRLVTGGTFVSPLDLEEPRNGLVMRPIPSGDEAGDDPEEDLLRLDLLIRPKDTDDPWLPLDSVRMTLTSYQRFYQMWSSRGDPSNTFYAYPLECHPQTACDAGDPVHVRGINIYPTERRVPGTGERDEDKETYFLFVHGYNVSLGDAKISAGKVAKRAYWAGFRGNMMAFTWHGDQFQIPVIGLSPFAPNVENAFQSGPVFLGFLRDRITGGAGWNVPPANVYVMAHSLGNQVVADALRLHSVLGGAGAPLFNRFLAVQPALWQETFWPQAAVTYTGGFYARTYTVDDLRTNSWTFWFTNNRHPAMTSVNAWIHSWAPRDSALFAMRLDDRLVRNFNQHIVNRGDSSTLDFRVPYEEEAGHRDLAHDVPVMVRRPNLPLFYGGDDLLLPAGTLPLPLSATPLNVDAVGQGWPPAEHSAFQSEPLPVIWPWWEQTVGLYVPMGEE